MRRNVRMAVYSKEEMSSQALEVIKELKKKKIIASVEARGLIGVVRDTVNIGPKSMAKKMLTELAKQASKSSPQLENTVPTPQDAGC